MYAIRTLCYMHRADWCALLYICQLHVTVKNQAATGAIPFVVTVSAGSRAASMGRTDVWTAADQVAGWTDVLKKCPFLAELFFYFVESKARWGGGLIPSLQAWYS